MVFKLCFLSTSLPFLLNWLVMVTKCEVTSVDSVQESDDDVQLSQALLLIDLLKSDYAKALRENDELRGGNTSDFTCPTTHGVSESNNTSPRAEIASSAYPSGNTQAQPPVTSSDLAPAALESAPSALLPQDALPSTPAQLVRQPVWAAPLHQFSPSLVAEPQYRRANAYNYFRRRIPDNYYYYDVPASGGANSFRRFIGHPDSVASPTMKVNIPLSGATSPPSTIVHSVTTTAPMTAVRTTTAAQSTTRADKKTVRHPKVSDKKVVILRRIANRVNKNTSAKGENIQTLNSPDGKTKDPIMKQVASELMNEFKGNVFKLKSREQSMVRSVTMPSMIHKSSLRIHLQQSTRYPIPLPENHAFCYTNPQNALCRTLIKK